MNDEFYIGWENRSAPPAARFTRRVVIGLLVAVLALALLLALRQQTIGVSVFEWGTIKKFSGVLKLQPYPHLLVPRPGATGTAAPFSSYYLVAPFKFALDPTVLARLDGQSVSLQGTLIYRDNQTMVEALPDSIRALDHPLPAFSGTESVPLGRQTLTGEIVDSKCFFGVMNPGQFIPHRDCAIRCLSGGIPPVLVVNQPTGPPLCLMLVSAEGKPVNQQILDLVAEPVQITGDISREGDLLILHANPDTYRRSGCPAP